MAAASLSHPQVAFGGVFVRTRIWLAAALIALAGCGREQSAPSGGPAAAPAASNALRAQVSDPRVRRFYEARGWSLAWTPASEAALNGAIGEAVRHGLDPAAFIGPIAGARGAEAHDAALSLAALSYGEALARGRTDPARIHSPYTVPRPSVDLAAALNRALRSGDVAGWLRGLAPQDEEYRLLSATYVQASQQVAQAQGRAPPALLERARTLAVNLERR